MSTTEEKILKQIEFYFSDSNLPYDKFLRSLVANDSQGYVSLETICSFKKTKQISTDMKEILAALSKSKMLEVDKEGKNVRRVTPLPENSTQDERSIYAKGFGEDSTLEVVQSFFEPFGKVLCVRLRYTKANPEKVFKGSVFVEFETEKEAQGVVGKEIKVKDEPLKIMMKKDYLKMKSEEAEEKKQQAKLEKYKSEIEELKEKRQILPKCMVQLENIGTKEELNFTQLKTDFKESYGDVQFVDWPLKVKGEDDKTKAIIRFANPESSEKMVTDFTKNEKKLGGGDENVKAKILNEKEEEQQFIEMIKTQKNDKQNKKRKGNFRGKNQKKRKRE
eukprot:gene922-9831_t